MYRFVVIFLSTSIGFSSGYEDILSSICGSGINPGVNGTSARPTESVLENCLKQGSWIYCNGATFTSFPRTFPMSTTCIVIQAGVLQELSADDLEYLPNLQTLGFVASPLEKLAGTFGKEAKLQNLIFRDTGLTTLPMLTGTVKELEISNGKLQRLDSSPVIGSALETLNVSNNPLSSLDSNLLSQLPITLRSLDLGDCPITTIVSATFPNLPSLKTLRISSQTVGKNAFQGLSGVQSFKLNTCRISSYAFEDLKKVVSLDLSNCCLVGSKSLVLERYAFSGMESVETLTLDNSGITRIPTKAFSGLPSIQSIRIRYNPLAYIMQGAFDGLSSLREVLLSDAIVSEQQNIVLLGDNTFSYAGLPDLAVLDISNLHLWNITRPTFMDLPSLERVYFNSNLLHFLMNGTFSNLPNLQTVRL